MAVWVYAPGYSGEGNPYHCNDCISSPDNLGCSCNWNYSNNVTDPELPEGIEGKDWRWVINNENEHEGISKITKEDGIWQSLDERGRPWPCAEYMYDKDGFDTDTIFNRVKLAFKLWWERHICATVPPDKDF